MRGMLFLVTLLSSTLLTAAPLAAQQPEIKCNFSEKDNPLDISERKILSTWRNDKLRSDIMAFVEKTTRQGSPDFIAPASRIAVFDNDGTLWSEKPIYVQLAFVLDRIRALSAQNPKWLKQEPFSSAIKGDLKTLFSAGEDVLLELVIHTHAGMTNEEFEAVVNEWIKTARHPKTGCLYTQMVYQPMLELINYLHENDYKVFIVSGGGAEFMRPWAEAVYKIPRERVIGSMMKLRYEVINGVPQLMRLPKVESLNDKSEKPVGILRHTGRRPVIAVGNSDGDLEMLAWTTAGAGPRLGLLLHHTDAIREEAYDRQSPVGRLNKALDLAPISGWKVIDMKNDWATVFAAP